MLKGLVGVLEKGQALRKGRATLLLGFGSGGPRSEAVDLVSDLGDQRVGSAGKTDGPDVVGYVRLL